METFGYSSILQGADLGKYEFASSPLIAQQPLHNKLDLRVTVVDEAVFCASITSGGFGIAGDWRLQKEMVTFQGYALPSEIESMCTHLVRDLGLSFGAIDLALREDDYFFLEVNPTGEWAWLLEQPGFPIDDHIARYLACVG